MKQLLSRRGFLGISVALPCAVRAGTSQALRVVSNPGIENAMLASLMQEQSFLERFGVSAQFVEAKEPSGPFDAIEANRADVCLVSGFNGVLARIAQGSTVRIIGAGMRKSALAIYARRDDGITSVAELRGRTVAVGPTLGLLHSLTIQLLDAQGIAASEVRFVDKGSNDQCHEAVVRGEADACCASVSHLYDADGLVALRDGRLWAALPQHVFQTAYASVNAIREREDEMSRLMAAYGALYDYLMSPTSRTAVAAARRRAQRSDGEASAWAVADFNIVQRPYARDLSLSSAEIEAMQRTQLRIGLLPKVLPFDQVADMRAAHMAARLG